MNDTVKNLVKSEATPIIVSQVASVDNMLAQAIAKDVSIDTMERLMTLREKMMAEEAKRAYYSSMADFQGVCPAIKKTRKVMNKGGQSVRYKYANLDDIVEQVGDDLKDHGFSYMTRSEPLRGESGDTEIGATVIATHQLGHSESSTFWVPVDTEAYMNNQQQVKSAGTFSMRVAFMNVFGIVTADDDDDAQSSGSGPNAQDIYKKLAEHAEAVREHWASVAAIRDGIATEDMQSAAEAYFELDDDAKFALQVAPSKGGIFTTQEREIMKSKDFREAYYGTTK